MSRGGRFLRSIGDGELSQPEDVALAGDNITVAVADTGNHRVRLYTLNGGQRLGVIGMQGRGNGQFQVADLD